MRNHYVYALFENKKPLYIGRGKGRRCFWFQAKELQDDSYGIKSKLLRMRNEGITPTMQVILSGLTFDESCVWERGLIALIGRRIKGTGPLWNLAAGGTSGYECARSHRQRLKDPVWRRMYVAALRSGAKNPVWSATWRYRQLAKSAGIKTINTKNVSEAKLRTLRDKYTSLGLDFPEHFFTG